jgi:hypothetical protein
MFSALTSTASAAFSYVTSFVPRPIANAASVVTEVALEAVSFLAAPRAEGAGAPGIRPFKSTAFFADFKTKTETPYEKTQLLRNLRSKPKVTKACLISDYLTLLPPSKVTHKIYDKLKTKWGYRQFYRAQDSGSKGLACAFLLHIMLEEGPKSSSMIHDRVVSFYNSMHHQNKYPQVQGALKPMLEAFQNGAAFINGVTSPDPCLFLDTLADTLVLNFYEKTGLTEELSLGHFIETLLEEPTKTSVKATLGLLGDFPSAPLVPLLGPKQSFFGHSPHSKFNFIMEHLPETLMKVKNLLKAHIDAQVVIEWLDALSPLKLLTAFETDPIAMARKETLKPRFIELFKQELVKIITQNASLFLEGFSFSKRASHVSLFDSLADELISLDPAYLEKLTTIPVAKLSELALTLESYEDELLNRQLRFINYLSDLFSVSFMVHSWQISQQDKKRLKIQHIGRWYGPTCHLVLFPENNSSRVDLLKQHGKYAARSELTDLILANSFKKFKRHGSETLSAIADDTSAASAADKLLAKHFIYYRLHIFACLQKMIHQKLPLLKDAARFDACGNKEDEQSTYNPFGHDHAELLPDFHTEVEATMFRLEKHLSGLNREIAELHYISDCVFSHTKHEEIISEIQLLLKAARKATFQFYLKKIPDFISGFTAIIASLHEEALKHFTALKSQEAAFTAVNATKVADFRSHFSKASYESLNVQELITLVPRLHLEHSPPPVFGEFTKLKKMIDIFDEAEGINQAAIEAEIPELIRQIVAEKARFLAFYADSADLFATIFETEKPLELTQEIVDSIIPKEKLMHAEIQKIVSKMAAVATKLGRLAHKKTILGAENKASCEALKASILSKREQFVAINPTKTEAFDRIFAEAQPWLINKGPLMMLKIVPKTPAEDAKIFTDLKTFIKILQKLASYKKEQTKLQERYAAYLACAEGGFAEVEIFEDDEVVFPEAGSLGAHDGDTASLGGASYSSELRSVGSVEKWVASLLV